MPPRSIAPLRLALRPRRPINPQSYICPTCRFASTTNPTTNSKGQIVLEKPDRFRPPSHPARRVTRTPRHYGPALTDAEIEAQKTKRYPHTFPADGTVMHKFLTNRSVHVYITLGVLLTFAFWAFLLDFHNKNKYPDLLPPRSMLLSNPVGYVAEYGRVYKMHVQALSVETAEKRKMVADEAKRRKEYLRHHGLDDGESGLLKRWGLGVEETPREKEDRLRREREEELNRRAIENTGGVVPAPKPVKIPAEREGDEEGQYRDFEGRERRVKKWFGIW